jgi:hypothetical protein
MDMRGLSAIQDAEVVFRTRIFPGDRPEIVDERFKLLDRPAEGEPSQANASMSSNGRVGTMSVITGSCSSNTEPARPHGGPPLAGPAMMTGSKRRGS